MTAPLGFGIARIGAGVTDLAIGAGFYEALGFEASPPFDLGTTLGEQSETPGSPLVIQLLRRDGFDLELVEHGGRRPPARPPARRPLNQLGLAYLALVVDDVERVASLVEASGGVVVTRETDKQLGVAARFCTDPFGIRLLLLEPGESALGSVHAAADDVGVAHVGIAVADLATSARFYAALGFDTGDVLDSGEAFSELAELDGVPLTTQHAHLGSYSIQLLQWGRPHDPGTPVRLPLNRNGDLIHFGTHCDDYDAMLDLVVGAGGSVVERTRAQFPPAGLEMPWEGPPHGWVFVLDPNGVEIEIVGQRSRVAAS
jgi:catechol 2,3-dioxygenase-like lactoylglutathione lyase family enzyme